MGERSNLIGCYLYNTQPEKFQYMKLAKAISEGVENIDSHFGSIKYVKDMDEKDFSTYDHSRDGDLYADWDDWKIQDYWYDGYCKFIISLQHAGVRGKVELVSSSDQEYIIYFLEEGIRVVFYGKPDEEYNEETDEYTVRNPEQVEKIDEIDTIEYVTPYNRYGYVQHTDLIPIVSESLDNEMLRYNEEVTKYGNIHNNK